MAGVNFEGKKKPTPVEVLMQELVDKEVVKKTSSLLAKIAEVMLYIKKNAEEENYTAVPCPSPRDWTLLSTGRHPVLPSGAILGMNGDESFRKFARTQHGGDLRRAAFAIAQQHLRDLKKASQPKKASPS